jgi:hypothetical protein
MTNIFPFVVIFEGSVMVLRSVRRSARLCDVRLIEVAGAFIKAVQSAGTRPLPEMVLAELAAHIPPPFEQFGDGRVLGARPELGTRQAGPAWFREQMKANEYRLAILRSSVP